MSSISSSLTWSPGRTCGRVADLVTHRARVRRTSGTREAVRSPPRGRQASRSVTGSTPYGWAPIRIVGAWPAPRTVSRCTRRADSSEEGVTPAPSVLMIFARTGPQVAYQSAVFAARWAASSEECCASWSSRSSRLAGSRPSREPRVVASADGGRGGNAGPATVPAGWYGERAESALLVGVPAASRAKPSV